MVGTVHDIRDLEESPAFRFIKETDEWEALTPSERERFCELVRLGGRYGDAHIRNLFRFYVAYLKFEIAGRSGSRIRPQRG